MFSKKVDLFVSNSGDIRRWATEIMVDVSICDMYNGVYLKFNVRAINNRCFRQASNFPEQN